MEPQGELSEGTLVETMAIEDPIPIVEEEVLLKEEPSLEEEAIVQEAPEVGEPAPQSPSVEVLEAVVLEEEPAEEPILVEEEPAEEPIVVEEEPILQTEDPVLEDPVVENLIEEDPGEVVLGEELLAVTGDLVEQEPEPFEEEPIVEILEVGVTEEDALVILLEETAPPEEEMLLEEAAPLEEEAFREEAAIPEEEVPLVEEVPLEEEAPLVEEVLISLSPDPVVTIEQETEGTTQDSVVMVEERVEEESREIFLERITERIEFFSEMTTEFFEDTPEVTTELIEISPEVTTAFIEDTPEGTTELIEISPEVTTEREGSPQMPSDPLEEDPAFEGTRFLEFTSPDYTVRVTYTQEAHIPNGAYITAREIPYGTDEYYAYLGDYEGSASFFDITIHDREGNEIQPEAPVSVEVIYASDVSGDVNVVHFSQEGGTEIGGEMDSSSSSITFSTDRF